jgi:hypothetical protein
MVLSGMLVLGPHPVGKTDVDSLKKEVSIEFQDQKELSDISDALAYDLGDSIKVQIEKLNEEMVLEEVVFDIAGLNIESGAPMANPLKMDNDALSEGQAPIQSAQ